MDSVETFTRMRAGEGMVSDYITMVTGLDTWTNGTSFDGPPPPPHIAAMKQANKIILIITLTFLMFAMGCVVQPRDFKEVFRSPKSILIGMLCQFILMPLTAFCLALALSLTTPFALGVLVMSCCPGGTVSNLFAFWTKGDVCLSISMTTMSTLVAIGMMPLNLLIYSRRWTEGKAVIPFVSIITSLVSIVIPVAIGMIVRWKREEWAPFISKLASILGLLGIATSITLTAVVSPAIYTVSWKLWFCVLTLPALGATFGYAIAWVLRRPSAHCRTIAFETGLQNVALGMSLVALTFDGSPIMLQVLAYPSLYGPVMTVEGLFTVAIYKAVVWCMKSDTNEDGSSNVNELLKKKKIHPARDEYDALNAEI